MVWNQAASRFIFVENKSDGVITNYPDEVNWVQTSSAIGQQLEKGSARRVITLAVTMWP